MANPIIPHSYPSTYRRVIAHTISYDFAKSISIETVHSPKELKPSEIFVKIKYAGVNASDINYVAGKYTPGAKPPLFPGFEGVGEVVLKGSKVSNLEIGDAVLLMGGGCFAEYQVVPQRTVMKIEKSTADYIVLFASGLTASLALEEVGQMKSKETVLVTAAAGGTGHIAVQLAKLAGNHVIGTCSSDSKAAKLKEIGCDRVINYNKESLDQVLKTEYPNGVDIVYESVGGETFDTCVNHLAIKGRLIVIGAISAYKDPNFWRGTAKSDGKHTPPLSLALLRKSASVRGFFLNNFIELWMVHFAKLAKLMEEGKLKTWVDDTKFVGLESVAKAVDHMYSGKNSGKVIIDVHGIKSNL